MAQLRKWQKSHDLGNESADIGELTKIRDLTIKLVSSSRIREVTE